MESIKLSKKILVLSLFVLLGSNISAQNTDAAFKAFKSSYALEGKKEYAKAAESLKAVYDEKSYEINLRMGWLMYMAGSHNESVNYYKKAIELKPYAIEPRLGYANPASVLGKWKEIEEMYDKALTIDPNNTLINYRKGLFLYNRGEFQNAEKCFEKVVNLYPFDYDGLHMLAWTKLNLKKTSEAKILFQKALLSQPDNKSDLEGLGLIK
jgi:tetratricopeptide (TPR) repeat protein